jgi:hypothetical protein
MRTAPAPYPVNGREYLAGGIAVTPTPAGR